MRALTFTLALALLSVPPALGADKTVLFMAGPKSHGPGEHEHPAGCQLLADHLNASGLPVKATVSEGWPSDTAALAAADTLVIYADGLEFNPANAHLDAIRQRYAAGKGLAILHFAVEPIAAAAPLWDQTIGGHFDKDWSVNPIWKMTDPLIGNHPATRGVQPFEIREEFYYHIRLRDDATPLLQAVPPESSLGADGPRSGNPAVRKALADKVPQTLAWVVENPNNSRGFGFTGGHFHSSWSNPDYRKLILNAIVWTAGLEVPAGGVTSTVASAPVHKTIEDAIAKADLEDVKLHLAANPANATTGRDPKRPPLAHAVLRNNTDITRLLLTAGADPNVPDASLRTPLHVAVERNNPDIVTALLGAKADPNPGDKAGWTPLHHCAAKNRVEIARILLANGADPTRLSELGGTPLHEAGASGGAEIIQLLLDHKVDPAIKSKEGVTALDLARKYKNQPAIDILSRTAPAK